METHVRLETAAEVTRKLTNMIEAPLKERQRSLGRALAGSLTFRR